MGDSGGHPYAAGLTVVCLTEHCWAALSPAQPVLLGKGCVCSQADAGALGTRCPPPCPQVNEM